LLYWPAREAGFVTDWLGGQEYYETGTIWDALHNFGWRALVPVLFVTNFTIYKLFGIYWLPWFLIFTGLHALNGWQLFRLVARLMPGSAGRNAHAAALGAGFLFLLSPYAAEPVVWKACIQYQFSLFLCFAALHRALRYFDRPHWRYPLEINALFLFSIYLTEWNIVMPGLMAAFVFVCTRAERNWSRLWPRLGVLVAPALLVLAGWFAVNRHYLGAWVGHDGAATHLNLDARLMFATSLKYLVKYATFVRYLEPALKGRLLGYCDQPAVLWGAASVFVLLFGVWLLRFDRLTPRLQWAGFAGIAFFIAVFPVSNLFFYDLMLSENDRHGYYASAFFWMAAALLLSGLPVGLFRVAVAVLLAFSAGFLLKTTRLWGASEAVYASLIRDFRWYDKEEVFILGSPDNLQGIYMMRIIGQPGGFDEALALRRKQPFKGKIWEVAQFNMTKPDDGVKVERDSAGTTYYAAFLQNGNWWWRNGIGASDYETERFVFQKKEWHVEMRLKEKRPGSVVIYPVGGRWLEIPE
jgi:hypothetical protein